MENHSSNPEHSEYQTAHNWAMIGLANRFFERYICWPTLYRPVSRRKNRCEYVATEEGIRQADIWDTAIALIFAMGSLLGGIPVYGGPAKKYCGCFLLQSFFPKTP